jgi:hypothetical protein
MYINSVHGYTRTGGGREDITMREMIEQLFWLIILIYTLTEMQQ